MMDCIGDVDALTEQQLDDCLAIFDALRQYGEVGVGDFARYRAMRLGGRPMEAVLWQIAMDRSDRRCRRNANEPRIRSLRPAGQSMRRLGAGEAVSNPVPSRRGSLSPFWYACVEGVLIAIAGLVAYAVAFWFSLHCSVSP